VEALDIQAVFEWIYDQVEDRWGKLAAWLVILGVFAAFAALVFAVIIRLF